MYWAAAILIEESGILSDTFAADGRLQIVFVGQPELHAKLKLPEMRQVDQRDVQQIVLGPFFSRAEALADLRRLQAQGGYDDASVIASTRE